MIIITLLLYILNNIFFSHCMISAPLTAANIPQALILPICSFQRILTVNNGLHVALHDFTGIRSDINNAMFIFYNMAICVRFFFIVIQHFLWCQNTPFSAK